MDHVRAPVECHTMRAFVSQIRRNWRRGHLEAIFCSVDVYRRIVFLWLQGVCHELVPDIGDDGAVVPGVDIGCAFLSPPALENTRKQLRLNP
eukprot:3780500-Amphidinium_carterae.1